MQTHYIGGKIPTASKECIQEDTFLRIGLIGSDLSHEGSKNNDFT